MKTFDKKDVFSWSNSEEAKTNIGKTGYFNNDFEGMKRAIELGDPTVLGRVDTNSIWCFKALGVSLCFGLFLPADKIKEVEESKKYRPFKSIDEFKKETGLDLLSIVHYRYITEKPKTITTIGFGVITDFNTCNDENYYITIGDISFNLDELFNYEYLSNNEWQPFGVEE